MIIHPSTAQFPFLLFFLQKTYKKVDIGSIKVKLHDTMNTTKYPVTNSYSGLMNSIPELEGSLLVHLTTPISEQDQVLPVANGAQGSDKELPNNLLLEQMPVPEEKKFSLSDIKIEDLDNHGASVSTESEVDLLRSKAKDLESKVEDLESKLKLSQEMFEKRTSQFSEMRTLLAETLAKFENRFIVHEQEIEKNRLANSLQLVEHEQKIEENRLATSRQSESLQNYNGKVSTILQDLDLLNEGAVTSGTLYPLLTGVLPAANRKKKESLPLHSPILKSLVETTDSLKSQTQKMEAILHKTVDKVDNEFSDFTGDPCCLVIKNFPELCQQNLENQFLISIGKTFRFRRLSNTLQIYFTPNVNRFFDKTGHKVESRNGGPVVSLTAFFLPGIGDYSSSTSERVTFFMKVSNFSDTKKLPMVQKFSQYPPKLKAETCTKNSKSFCSANDSSNNWLHLGSLKQIGMFCNSNGDLTIEVSRKAPAK